MCLPFGGHDSTTIEGHHPLSDIKTLHAEISNRLAEVEQLIAPLRAEADQLNRLLATFDGDTPTPSARAAVPAATRARAKAPRKAATRASRPATAKPSSKRGRPAGSGNRAQQALARITDQPGITASELAAAMGIAPNYLYRVLPQLQADGKITKQGKGYHLAGTQAPVVHTNGHGVTA
jgi:hypothetical protein